MPVTLPRFRLNRKRNWLILAGVVVCACAVSWAWYAHSHPSLSIGKDDIVINQGCTQKDSTSVVIHPDGSGYISEGQLSCLGGTASAPGKPHGFATGFFAYGSLLQTISAVEHVPEQNCVVDESFITVTYHDFSSKNIACYGANGNSGSSSDPGVQKLNTLADAVQAAESKALDALH